MVEEHIDSMLAEGIYQESSSPWSQLLVIVTKKNGSLRFCVDFSKLNAIAKKEIFPMLRVEEVLDILGNSCFFTTLELALGCWPILMKPEDTEKIAVCTTSGNFEFRLMPIGLVNASYTFHRNVLWVS